MEVVEVGEEEMEGGGLMMLCSLIVVAASVAVASAADKHHQRDVEALLSFRNHIKSDPFGRLSNWTTKSSKNMCLWDGISCTKHFRRVVAIDLGVSTFKGTIPASLGNL